jgi:hypothetical protein
LAAAAATVRATFRGLVVVIAKEAADPMATTIFG